MKKSVPDDTRPASRFGSPPGQRRARQGTSSSPWSSTRSRGCSGPGRPGRTP